MAQALHPTRRGVPELPEVETARRQIERSLLGKHIVTVTCTLPKLLRDSPLPDLSLLQGKRLRAADRRAKVLILTFDEGLSLLVHFKLSGQWATFLADGSRLVAGHPVPDPSGPYPHKSTHVTFTFEDDTIAYFSDVRQFGWLRLTPSDDVAIALDQFGFGPEASGELDGVELRRVFARRGAPIKTVLLDQTVIAGLGNIYVDEVLFRSGVHPARAANRLTPIQVRNVIAAVGPVLEAGIAQGGAKIVHNRAFPVNKFPAVHGREGESCFVCGSAIRKIRVGGRGTYFCPTCQKPPRVRRSTPGKPRIVA
ncbi:MAG: bifunctional DNA-formamidopyrimidine glycosylase/DNA-(apurinic or apyrimidinic site) lyase [Chloroflexia bacterium]|nr:bifunctional DNA-formamidopyrimidine glycosylase/DNA-(apurinic or apyrimidinic site) lyase [Chloroflexia bacterium]